MKHAVLMACAGLALSATSAMAQDVTLRIHHFMSERATLHAQTLVALEEALETKSDGRIEVQLFAAMSLGGGPADLYDQAADGAVDIILTLPGYTAGRFPQTEVFELPFLMEDVPATGGAFYDMVQADLQDGEYDQTKILGAWVHGRGALHSETPIASLADMAGQEVRGPTRMITNLLGELGAIPVGMPLPAIPENLSKGVLTGTALPWEITPSIRLAELVTNHTEFDSAKAFYTATFILAMNWDAYDDMPEDLRALLDAETGKAFSMQASAAMAAADKVGRQVAVDAGNTFVLLDAAEVALWEQAAQPVYDAWIADSADEGFDGAATIAKARELIAANQ